MTNLAGIEIPSTNPVFLAIVAIHILMGLTCVVAGAVAMLSPKRPGRHPTFGTIYFWCLAVVFLSAVTLSMFRWAEDYQFALLGTLSFALALFGRTARRRRWTGWPRLHITGNGDVVCRALDRVLRRQRKELAVLEGAAPDRLLATARYRRPSNHHLGTPHAPSRVGAARQGLTFGETASSPGTARNFRKCPFR